MALQQSFHEPEQYLESDGDILFKKKWSSIPASTAVSENANGCFDCNICLDSAQDPVVTICGHLYCWPCIYRWLHVQSSSPEPEQQQQPKCPVCKAEISHSTLVPLYGRGTSSSDSESEKPHSGLIIPHRPPPLGLNTSFTSTTTSTSHQLPQNLFRSRSQTFHHQQYFSQPYGGTATTGPSDLRSIASTSVFNPTIGMLGEMVFATMFGSSDTSLFAYPNSYPLMGSTSPRMRRQEMQLDKSLNRVSIFLFCCFILCLLLF